MLGLGAGWHEPEHRAFGYDVLSLGDRISRFDEASRVARGMLDGESVTFEGRWVQRPRPAQRPAAAPGPDAAAARRQRRATRAADRGPRRRHLERRGRSGDVRPQVRGPRPALCRDRSRPADDPADGRRPAGLHPGDPRGGRRRAGRDPCEPGRQPDRRPGVGGELAARRHPRRRGPAASAPGTRPGPRRPSSICRRRSTTRRSSSWPARPGASRVRARASNWRSCLMRAAVYEGEGRLVVRDVARSDAGTRRGPDRGRGVRGVRLGRPDHQRAAGSPIDSAGHHRPRVRRLDPRRRVGRARRDHRCAGRRRSGSEVRRLRARAAPGDRRTASNIVALGVYRDGALARYVTAPANSVYPISPDVPAAMAALVEPLSCVVNGTNRAAIRPGEIGGRVRGRSHRLPVHRRVPSVRARAGSWPSSRARIEPRSPSPSAPTSS